MQHCRVVNRPVTADDFRLFLCHLHFASHYCYPPYLPKTDINLDTAVVDDHPTCLQFTSVTHLDMSDQSTQMRFVDDTSNAVDFNEALLTLAQYLRCAAMVRQCETMLLLASSPTSTDDIPWLPWQSAGGIWSGLIATT